MHGFITIKFLYLIIAISLAFLVVFVVTGIIAGNKFSKQSINEPGNTAKQEIRNATSSNADKSIAEVDEASDLLSDSTSNQLKNSEPKPEIDTQNIEPNVPVEQETFTTENQAETVEESTPFSFSFSDINISTREAIVNIFCTTKGSGPFNPTSGSGVIIDERGVILTNAHIAQYFLLKDYPSKDFVDCIIRTGSPAQPHYRATLLFIPTIWIENNAEKIRQENPRGNGENDYAFLLIKETIKKGYGLPKTFSSVKPIIDEKVIEEGKNVLIAGYPAGFLGGIAIQKDLYMASTITDVKKIFTFKENTPDLLSLGGSIVAQQGVSGGAVVNKENELIGIIVTSSDGETTDERDLRAITLSHISQSLEDNASTTLNELLSGDLFQKAFDFNENKAPTLTKPLVDVLE